MTRVTKWGLVVLFWLGASASYTSFAYYWRAAINHPAPWINLAPFYFTAYAPWGVFTPIVVWLSRRFPLERGLWKRSIFLHAFFAPCIGIIHALITTLLGPWFWPDMVKTEPWAHALRRNFLMNGSDDLFIYWSLICVVLALTYYQRYRDRELRTSMLETQLARTQLQALKVQLHPHFLFNTLNSVSELMHQDVRVAERVITRLSDLLRMTLENIGAQEVTLRDEVDFVKGYLEIEQTRFQDRLKVQYDVASETLDAPVPNLLLQPLVENAVRHGISKSSRPGLIQIKSQRQGTRIEISVRDNGPGLKPNGHTGGTSFGIGLSTTRSRLEFLYGKDQSLSLNNLPEGGLEVRIVIPYHPNVTRAELSTDSLTNQPESRPTLEGVRS